MNFLILSRLPSIYSTRRLVQEAEARGHHVRVENPEITGEGLSVDVLVPRLGTFRYEESLAALRLLEQQKKPPVVLNTAEAYENSRHKKMALQLLASLPQPKLYEEVRHFPVVVKDCISSQGEGVFLCSNQTELELCLYKLQGRPLLFQEFIAESRGRDVRVFVIGSQIAGAMERRSQNPELEFRSNISLGGVAQPTVLTTAEKNLCLEAVRILNLSYAGVDFVRSERGPLILEINPCPGLEGIEKWSQRNITKDLILHAESLYNSHS